MSLISKYTHILMFFCCICCSGKGLFAQIVSDFTIDDETWKVYNEPSGGAPSLPIVWSSTGGNPGGYIKETDISIGAWGWQAPAEFKGDLSAYFGCYLVFDLIEDSHAGVMNNYYDVMFFNNAGDTMVFNTAYDPIPINTWINYVVPLTTVVGWKYGSSIAAAAPDATGAQMLAILSDVNKMRIRAEFSGLTYEVNGMDNVMLTCILLPVELINFNAEVAGVNMSKLSWSTASENNCYGFRLEKSVDFSVFDSIGFIPGNGTTTSINNYEFYDNNFNTSAYYRLREVNLEGRMLSSEIVYLENENNNIVTTLVYPNPTTDNIIILADDVNQVLQYVITDYSGRTLLQANVEPYSGYFRQTINMEPFPAGIYTATLIKEQGTDIQLFTLVK